MQTRKPTKKQKLLADAAKELDGSIELKVIDYEMCLYKLRADGNFDVEVSGTGGNGKYCTAPISAAIVDWLVPN